MLACRTYEGATYWGVLEGEPRGTPGAPGALDFTIRGLFMRATAKAAAAYRAGQWPDKAKP